MDGEGKRLIGGLAEGGRADVGEAWTEERKLIAGPSGASGIENLPADFSVDETTELQQGEESSGSALVNRHVSSSSTALVISNDNAASAFKPSSSSVSEQSLPPNHPLNHALTAAGLPGTALLSSKDGAVVPYRDTTSGSGEGRGRGAEDKARRDETESVVMGEQERETVSLGGSGADLWGYKVSR